MIDDATLSTPPAPDAVKRYCINRVRGEDCLVGIYEPPNGPEQFVTAEVEFVLASDYDSLARQRDALKARVEAQREAMQRAIGEIHFDDNSAAAEETLRAALGDPK